MSEENKKGLLSDMLKSALNTGMGAASLTEEVVKGIISEVAQKESVSHLIDSAKTSKDELIKSLKSEIGGYLSQIDLQSEIDRILEEYDVTINAKVNFKKKKTKKK